MVDRPATDRPDRQGVLAEISAMISSTRDCAILNHCAAMVGAMAREDIVEMIFSRHCASAYLIFITVSLLQGFAVTNLD